MRRASYIVILLALFVGSARAADWTGWSIGLTGGGGSGHSSQTDSGIPCSFFGTCCPKVVPELKAELCLGPPPPPPPPPELRTADGSYHMSGGLFGGGATYNFWQSGPWVLGAAGDLSWAGVSGNSSARIYCQKIEAELIAIDGYYQTAEELDEKLRGRPVQARLDGQTMTITLLN